MKRPLLGLALSLAVGIGMESFLGLGLWTALVLTGVCLAAFFIFCRHDLSLPLIFCAMCAFGLFRLALSDAELAGDDLGRVVTGIPAWVECRGVVISDPEYEPIEDEYGNTKRTRGAATIRVDAVKQFAQWRTCQGKVRLFIRDLPPGSLRYGDQIIVRGQMRVAEGQKNFYLFDYAQWLGRQGVRHTLFAAEPSSIRILAHDRGHLLSALGYKLRQKVNASLRMGLENEPELSAVMSGMLLGYREDIPEHVSEEFQRTGAFHILAVSGQNLTFLAFAFILICRAFGLSKWKCGYIVLPVLLLYCASVGWQPGCLRAFWMAFAVIGSWILIRPSDLLNSVGFAALVTLLWDPRQLFDVGFQFSFAVVISLIVFTPMIWAWVKKYFEPDSFLIPELVSRRDKIWKYGAGGLTQLFISSLVAWVGSLPFTIFYFNTFAPVTVMANMFIVPMATIILFIGLLAFMGGLINPSITILYNNANFVFLKILLGGIHFFSTLPLACFYVSFDAPKPLSGEVLIHSLEAERSQAYILQTRQEVYVIDTGNEQTARYILVPYLKALGVNRIDSVILTHADLQHAGGVSYLLRNLRVDEVMINPYRGRSKAYNKMLDEILLEAKIPVRTICMGDSLDLAGGVRMSVLHPALPQKFARADESALVIEIKNSERTLLMSSDAGEQTLQALHELSGSMGARAELLLAGMDSKANVLPVNFMRQAGIKVMIASGSRHRDYAPKTAIPETDYIEEEFGRVIHTANSGGVQIRMAPAGIQIKTAREQKTIFID